MTVKKANRGQCNIQHSSKVILRLGTTATGVKTTSGPLRARPSIRPLAGAAPLRAAAFSPGRRRFDAGPRVEVRRRHREDAVRGAARARGARRGAAARAALARGRVEHLLHLRGSGAGAVGSASAPPRPSGGTGALARLARMSRGRGVGDRPGRFGGRCIAERRNRALKTHL
jgi:hypothetical protein